METQTQNPEEPQTWGQARWDDSIRLRQADYAVGIQRHLKKERLLRRLAKKTMDGTVGKPTTEPEETGDDMIVLGNYTVTIGAEKEKESKYVSTQQPVPQQPQPVPQQQQPTQQPKSTWQKMWPWLLAASIPAAGLGGAAIANYWSKPVPTQDTWMDWDFKTAQPATNGGVRDNGK